MGYIWQSVCFLRNKSYHRNHTELYNHKMAVASKRICVIDALAFSYQIAFRKSEQEASWQVDCRNGNDCSGRNSDNLQPFIIIHLCRQFQACFLYCRTCRCCDRCPLDALIQNLFRKLQKALAKPKALLYNM